MGREERGAALEIRGRVISGVALPWGARARVRTPAGEVVDETFVRDAFDDLKAVPLLLEHRGPVIGEVTPSSTDRGLEVAGEYSGDLGGRDRFSIEFEAVRETRSADLRIVHGAALHQLAAVAEPAYDGARIEARRRIGGVKSSIPFGKALDCRCADGCTEAVIEPSATIDISETAIAIRRGYAEALASRSKGTMRVLVDDGGIHLDLDLPDTSYARDLLEAADNVPLIVRPVVDFAASVWAKDGALARFTRLVTPAFVVGFSDMSRGHQEAVTSNRRRLWL